MAELLIPSFPPLELNKSSFYERFSQLAAKSDYMRLTSGYVSDSAIFFFRQNTKLLPSFDLVIGMHGIEGFTRSQYEGLRSLKTEMTSSCGSVYVSDSYKFHGKAYSFFKNQKPFASLVGSTNISLLGDPDKRQFEIDILLEEESVLSALVDVQSRLISTSTEIDAFLPTRYVSSSNVDYLQNLQSSSRAHISRVSGPTLRQLRAQGKPARTFLLRLKCEEKSNLNVYFGKGRGGGISGRGNLIQRSWLECEIIVTNSVTSMHGYPYQKEFLVRTDDDWEFKCSTQGQNAKNFRSADDLHVLGAWLKGRLLNSGCVNYGDKITESHLAAYGRNSLSLESYGERDSHGLEIFYLDFSSTP